MGQDVGRLRHLLDGKRECRCTRKTCYQMLSTSFDTVRDFTLRFHGLNKLDQDEFVPCCTGSICASLK